MICLNRESDYFSCSLDKKFCLLCICMCDILYGNDYCAFVRQTVAYVGV